MPRLTSRVRCDLILSAALRLASEPGGWNSLTIAKVAIECHCTPGLIFHFFKSAKSLRSKVVRAAIKQENFDILIQALTAGDPEAKRMKPMLRNKAFAHTLNSGA
jgi:AcrR family transcriptional regulator